MIAFDDRALQAADDFQAFVRIGVVADDVPEADVVGAAVFTRIGQNGLERFEVRMDVAEDRKAHG